MNTNENTNQELDVNTETEQDEDENLPLTTPVVKQSLYTKSLRKELSKLPSKSAQIRHLSKKGVATGDIARILTEHYGKNVRYQHVRNILVTPVKNPK